MDYNYLIKIGYTESEIEEYFTSWNNNITEYLAENSEYVSRNMNYLKSDFDHDLLLKLPVFYPDTFTLKPEVFEKRIIFLKNVFPESWTDIVEKQFFGYSGIGGETYEPIMQVLCSHDESKIESVAKQLQNPQEIVFGFMLLLMKNVGIQISADYCDEDFLWDMEEQKYEIVRNAIFLIDQGLSKEMVSDIICYAPFLMGLSELEVKERLSKSFGEKYISEMQKMDEELFMEKLEEIAW